MQFQFIAVDGETPIQGFSIGAVNAAPAPTLALQFGDFADRSRLVTINQLLAFFSPNGASNILVKYGIVLMPFQLNAQVNCQGYMVNRQDVGIPSLANSVGIQDDQDANSAGGLNASSLVGGNNTSVEINVQVFWPNGPAGSSEIQGKTMLMLNLAQFVTALRAADVAGAVQNFLASLFHA